MKRTLAILTLCAWPMAHGQTDAFPDRWGAFAAAMNDYIDGLNHGQVKADRLRAALRQWRRMEKENGWEQLR